MSSKFNRVIYDDSVAANGTVRKRVPVGTASTLYVTVAMTNATAINDIDTITLYSADGKGITSAIPVDPIAAVVSDFSGARAEHQVAFDTRGLTRGEIEVVSAAAAARDLEIHIVAYSE